ncbi:uncharacterized protein EKO05_0001911 [Ascochyta rabiei]|uniref:Uncharacterized protein n=1 Tax=Didymella rabiei TaxID=5454 RepID=A0A163I3T9_DIDRA|nr:uncharacterized protein EKO05_0001911 [Ascochyta rabiei]KZM25591.1 hypothetical protein ST47_g3291 [Ascochyta rabiei]UPX11300.1 hypothetical protein EKO05_0001911 [Ascochyta rabiei]
MLTAISKLFVVKAVTTNVAGIALTHDEAIQLSQTCSVLKLALDSQLHAIHELPAVPFPQITSQIRHIQLKHLDTQTQLSSVILKTQNSTQPWTHEFADAQKALENKIVSINRCSRKVGLVATALQSWPVVAETCVWLLPIVVRLQSELDMALERKETWSADIRLQAPGGSGLSTDRKQQEPTAIYTDGPRVSFGTEVTVREYRTAEAASGGGGGEEEEEEEET